MELLARGIKKIVSKNAAHVEPFSLVAIDIARGKEIDHLTKVQSLHYFSPIRTNLEKSMAAVAVVAITDKILDTGVPEPKLFYILQSWLGYVEKASSFKPVLADAYVVKLFDQLGFTPQLEACVVCKKSYHDIVKEELDLPRKKASPSRGSPRGSEAPLRGGFYFAGGGLICSDCRMQKEQIGERIWSCGLKEISDMQVLLHGEWRVIDQFPLEKSQAVLLHRLIYEFVLFHSERKISDWSVRL